MTWSPQARQAAAAARKAKGGSTIKRNKMGKLAPKRHTPLMQAANRKAHTKSGQKPIFQTVKKYPSSPIDGGPKKVLPAKHSNPVKTATGKQASGPKALSTANERTPGPRDLKGAKNQAAFIAENKRRKGYAKTFAKHDAAVARKRKGY